MSDYISREAANDTINETAYEYEDDEAQTALYHAADRLNELPAADVVEVRHASWVWNPDGMDWGIGAWVCGKCKSRPETWWNTVKESHPLRCSGSRYCGNCGAKMDGGQEK